MSLRSSKHLPPPDNPPYHRKEEVADEDDGDVVHVVRLDGHDGGKTEEDCGEDGPKNTIRQITPQKLASSDEGGVIRRGWGRG